MAKGEALREMSLISDQHSMPGKMCEEACLTKKCTAHTMFLSLALGRKSLTNKPFSLVCRKHNLLLTLFSCGHPLLIFNANIVSKGM